MWFINPRGVRCVVCSQAYAWRSMDLYSGLWACTCNTVLAPQTFRVLPMFSKQEAERC